MQNNQHSMIHNQEILTNQLSNNEVQRNQQMKARLKNRNQKLQSLLDQEKQVKQQLQKKLQKLYEKKKQVEQNLDLPQRDILLEFLSDKIQIQQAQKVRQENIYRHFRQNLEDEIQAQQKRIQDKKKIPKLETEIAEMKNKQKTQIVLFWIGAAALFIILVLSVLITFNQKYAFLPPDVEYWIGRAMLICGLIFLSVYFVSNWPH